MTLSTHICAALCPQCLPLVVYLQNGVKNVSLNFFVKLLKVLSEIRIKPQRSNEILYNFNKNNLIGKHKILIKF